VSIVSIDRSPVGELTREGARLLTDRIRGRLESAWDELQRAIEQRAWEVLGYASWADYQRAEFGDLRLLRISADQRKDIVGALRSQGMSVRAVASALGVSVGTVHADTAPASVTRLRAVKDEPTLTVAESQLPKTDRVVALISAQGGKGMTCLELEYETGWRHGVASGPLSAVAKRGRVRATGTFRDGYGVYVTTA
jgi:hypothetical protein